MTAEGRRGYSATNCQNLPGKYPRIDLFQDITKATCELVPKIEPVARFVSTMGAFGDLRAGIQIIYDLKTTLNDSRIHPLIGTILDSCQISMSGVRFGISTGA